MEKKPKLERAKEIMEIIVIECKDDFSVCNEVTIAFENVRKPMADMWIQIEARQNRLQDALLQSQKFQESLDDFLDSLTRQEERMDKEKPVSAKLETVKEQKKEHAQVHNDIMQIEPVFEQLVKTAEEIIVTSEPGDEKEKLKERIDLIKKRYEDIKQKSTEKQKKLVAEVVFTQKFADKVNPFKSWLDVTEKKIAQFEPLPCDENTIARQIKDIKELRRNIQEKKPKLESLEKTAESAIDNAEVDQPIVDTEYKTTENRYNKLYATLDDREEKLTELLSLAQEYKKQLKPIDDLFDKVEHCVICFMPLYGIDEEKIGKEQETLNDLVKEFTDVLPAVKRYNDTSRALTDKADEESPEQAVIKKQVANINDRHKRLRDQLHDKYDKLNEYASKATEFNEQNSDFSTWYDRVSRTPAVIEPIGTEPEVVKRQLQEVEVSKIFFTNLL